MMVVQCPVCEARVSQVLARFHDYRCPYCDAAMKVQEEDVAAARVGNAAESAGD